MKKVIEKAIKNGFKFCELDFMKLLESDNDYEIIIELKDPIVESGLISKKFLDINIYQLIFCTNFIDHLIDETNTCGLLLCYPSYINSKLCTDGKQINDCMNCGNTILSSEYHRSRISNIQDIRKIKQYLRNLI